MLDLLSPSGLLALGRSSLAAASRLIAASLRSVADALDGGSALDRDQGSAIDPSQPTAGTRERIAEVLKRARTQYDAMGARSARHPARNR